MLHLPVRGFQGSADKVVEDSGGALGSCGGEIGAPYTRHHGDGKVIPKEINVRGNNAQALISSVILELLTDHPNILTEDVEFAEPDG